MSCFYALAGIDLTFFLYFLFGICPRSAEVDANHFRKTKAKSPSGEQCRIWAGNMYTH